MVSHGKSSIFKPVVKSAIVFICFILFCLLSATAQQDSLKAQLNNKLTPSEHLAVLEQLIEANKFDNRPQCLVYGKQAYQYVNQLQDNGIKAKARELIGNAYLLNFKYDTAFLYLKEGLAFAGKLPQYNEKLYLYLGDTFWYTGLFDSSLVQYTNGQKSTLATNNLTLKASLTINIADYYRQIGNFDKALTVYQEGIVYAQQDKTGKILPKAFNNAALLYSYIGDTYTELDYYFKGIAAAKKVGDSRVLGLLYSNISEAYATLGDFPKALKYAANGIEKSKKANQLRHLMSAYEMLGTLYLQIDSIKQARASFTESIRLNDQLKDIRFVARNLGNMGDLEKRVKNYAQAIHYYEKAIVIHNQIAQKKFKIEDLIGIAQSYLALGNLALAKRNNDEALVLAQSLNIRQFIAQSYLLTSDILAKKSDIRQALVFRKRYDSLHVLLEKEDRIKYVNNLEKLNQAKVKELESLRLKKDIELQAEIIDRQESLFSAGLVLIMTLLAISTYILWLLQKNQKAKRVITAQNENLINKNAEIQSISKQQENLIHLVVHDLRAPLNKIEGLANILRLGGGLNENQEHLLEMMERISRKSKIFIYEFLETSEVEYRSKQPSKEYFDLVLLIDEIKEEYTPLASKKEIEIVWDLKWLNQQAYSDKDLLYHIALNLLSNAIKYSPNNTQIQFVARRDGTSLNLSIKDQGQGFNVKDKQSIYKKYQKLSARPIGLDGSTGLGLFLTKVMVDALKGSISLESEVNKGSTFTLIFRDIFISHSEIPAAVNA